jgi:cysteine sulfinate desulfinase/cysteine desulfurase-like protein
MRACFDHSATPPFDKSVLAQMLPGFKQKCGNASSRHDFGARVPGSEKAFVSRIDCRYRARRRPDCGA